MSNELLDKIITKPTVDQDGDSKKAEICAIIAGATNQERDLYLNSSGITDVTTGQKVTNDSIIAFFSCTKMMTAMSVLQLYDAGKVDLDVPAEKYIPELGLVGVVEEEMLDEDGSYIANPRPPATKVTIKHLLTHTAGFSYPFLSYEYSLLMQKNPTYNAVNPHISMFSNNHMPLIHEPGQSWLYGYSYDWVGLIVERVSGMKLEEYMKKNIFEPAGMSSCTFHLKDSERLVKLHGKSRDGSLKKMRGQGVDLDPAMDMGGQGCFGTVGDYLKFMRIWLNFGISPDTGKKFLESETVEWAIKNHLALPASISMETVANFMFDEEIEPDGFTLAGCAYLNNKLPTGRGEGSIYWSGLANVYFWIDFKNKIAGFWASQMFPVMKPKCISAYIEFEKAIYDTFVNKEKSKL